MSCEDEPIRGALASVLESDPRVRGEYVANVKRRFDEVGIDIPYPIRTLDGDIELSEVPAAEAADD